MVVCRDVAHRGDLASSPVAERYAVPGEAAAATATAEQGFVQSGGDSTMGGARMSVPGTPVQQPQLQPQSRVSCSRVEILR